MVIEEKAPIRRHLSLTYPPSLGWLAIPRGWMKRRGEVREANIYWTPTTWQPLEISLFMDFHTPPLGKVSSYLAKGGTRALRNENALCHSKEEMEPAVTWPFAEVLGSWVASFLPPSLSLLLPFFSFFFLPFFLSPFLPQILIHSWHNSYNHEQNQHYS